MNNKAGRVLKCTAKKAKEMHETESIFSFLYENLKTYNRHTKPADAYETNSNGKRITLC